MINKYKYYTILFIVLFTYCTHIEPNMLPGKYVDNGYNLDTIIVNSNGKYFHVFYTSHGNKFQDSGAWNFNSNINEIRFHNFNFYNDEGGGASGVWIPKVKSLSNGEIRLIYSSENNIYYKKVINH